MASAGERHSDLQVGMKVTLYPMSCLVYHKEHVNTQEHDTTPKMEEIAMRSQSESENMRGNHANLNFSMVADISR